MSHFELRDSLSSEGASSGFKGRVADVFAGLGTGLVKSDKSDDEKMKNIKGIFLKILFNSDQLILFYRSKFLIRSILNRSFNCSSSQILTASSWNG